MIGSAGSTFLHLWRLIYSDCHPYCLHYGCPLLQNNCNMAFNLAVISSAIRQKGKPQNGCYKKTKQGKYSEKRTFLTPDTHTSVLRFTSFYPVYPPSLPKFSFAIQTQTFDIISRIIRIILSGPKKQYR